MNITIGESKSNVRYVWDLPLRLFHWLLVIALTGSYMTIKLNGEWLYWHMHIGIFIFSLIIFRICWGFWGTLTARFKSFIPTPKRIREYSFSNKPAIGHSPHSAISVFLLLGIILIQTISGMFSLDDEIDIQGPLHTLVNASVSNFLTYFHSTLFYVLLSFCLLHILAIGYYVIIKQKELVLPMITGYATRLPETDNQPKQQIGIVHLITSIMIPSLLFCGIENGVFIKWINMLFN